MSSHLFDFLDIQTELDSHIDFSTKFFFNLHFLRLVDIDTSWIPTGEVET
jgi:hypothetical protein